MQEKYIVVHPGVSEQKREYPTKEWINIIHHIRDTVDLPMIISGSASELKLAQDLASATGTLSLAGQLTFAEFIALIDSAATVVSVNTATIHIAAAMQTPVVVLYASTNPQHTPWQVASRVFYFPVDPALQSRNEVIRYVNGIMPTPQWPTAEEVAEAVQALLVDQAKLI